MATSNDVQTRQNQHVTEEQDQDFTKLLDIFSTGSNYRTESGTQARKGNVQLLAPEIQNFLAQAIFGVDTGQNAIIRQQLSGAANSAIDNITGAGDRAVSNTGRGTVDRLAARAGITGAEDIIDQIVARAGRTGMAGDVAQINTRARAGTGIEGLVNSFSSAAGNTGAKGLVDFLNARAGGAEEIIRQQGEAAAKNAQLDYRQNVAPELSRTADAIGSKNNSAFQQINSRAEGELATRLAGIRSDAAVRGREAGTNELLSGLQAALSERELAGNEIMRAGQLGMANRELNTNEMMQGLQASMGLRGLENTEIGQALAGILTNREAQTGELLSSLASQFTGAELGLKERTAGATINTQARQARLNEFMAALQSGDATMANIGNILKGATQITDTQDTITGETMTDEEKLTQQEEVGNQFMDLIREMIGEGKQDTSNPIGDIAGFMSAMGSMMSMGGGRSPGAA